LVVDVGHLLLDPGELVVDPLLLTSQLVASGLHLGRGSLDGDDRLVVGHDRSTLGQAGEAVAELVEAGVGGLQGEEGVEGAHPVTVRRLTGRRRRPGRGRRRHHHRRRHHRLHPRRVPTSAAWPRSAAPWPWWTGPPTTAGSRPRRWSAWWRGVGW